MKGPLTVRQHERLRQPISSRIHDYLRCQNLLRYVDREIYKAGLESFGSESVLALWLCEPARALGYNAPLRVMSSAKGRLKVLNLLCALAHGD